jgi:hypothetical protein
MLEEGIDHLEDGKNAAGAGKAVAEMTAEKAAMLDPPKVQAAKAFYENAVANGKAGAAASEITLGNERPARRSSGPDAHGGVMENNARVTLRVTNSLEDARTVVLEPWTGEYTLQPGKSFDIVAEGQLSFPLQVELSENQVIVHCFDSAGAKMSIFQDGTELTTSE